MEVDIFIFLNLPVNEGPRNKNSPAARVHLNPDPGF